MGKATPSGSAVGLRIERDDVRRDDIVALLTEHMADMRAESPPESVHALDVEALAQPGIAFLTARTPDGDLLGCGALKELSPSAGELKSMRTAAAARGRGVGGAVLASLTEEGRRRGYSALYLETGSQEFFAPARRLYERAGFRETDPFGDYTLDPYSVYMVLAL
ncbi:GNAT family N-acetyltransferase [Naasia sp. SYSU D00057]|uniref:GNAT family N-acetyltransferase n=1 Tax=Naasia sp. SYSU D00057 TaxID=2817380 RepID=UPI001B30E631|nr:GNAT family N-acetyltransferase [Naasia sp. SYSU D00057]